MPDKRVKGDQRKGKETEIPAHTTFFGEIGEVDTPRSKRRMGNALEETGRDDPANFVSDDNWSEKM